MYVVELGTSPVPFYLAVWPGDPGRTFDLNMARMYRTRRGAAIALGMARRHRPRSPFRLARIVRLDEYGKEAE